MRDIGLNRLTAYRILCHNFAFTSATYKPNIYAERINSEIQILRLPQELNMNSAAHNDNKYLII